MGEVAANVARAGALVEQAAAQGARLVVLPELANTGYMFESREEACALAETVPDGPSARAWIALAQRLGIHLVAGIAERDGGRLYNSALVAGPQGYLGTYRKLHLWGDENLYFERATWACRCSTPSSAGWAWPSATTAGSPRSTGCWRCAARTSWPCPPTGCRCRGRRLTARRWRTRWRSPAPTATA